MVSRLSGSLYAIHVTGSLSIKQLCEHGDTVTHHKADSGKIAAMRLTIILVQ
jgi:hypothetical protein